MRSRLITRVATILLAGMSSMPCSNAHEPAELGSIKWLRDLDEASRLAREQAKPILLLFQEVPGCGTCVNYGRNVLSHPQVAEAAETLFVPVAIYNNRPGKDAAVLEAFGEPGWNNPVVRMVDADHRPLAPRLSANYSVRGMALTMIAALEELGRDVPSYLRLLAQEAEGTESVVLAMACFWSGERVLGAMDGVVATQPGFLDGREVVEVTYDPGTIGFEQLLQQAARQGCASKVYTRTPQQQVVAAKVKGATALPSSAPIRPDRQPKYYLGHSSLRYVPMTPLQAARVNAALGSGSDPVAFLSPRQLELWEAVRDHPRAGWPEAHRSSNLVDAWRKAGETMAIVSLHDRTR